MAARLMIQRPGEAAAPIASRPVITFGEGQGDDVRVTGLAERALLVSPSAEGVVLEARGAGIVVAGHPLAPGKRRLLRPSERAEAGGVTLWPERPVPPDGTRALAGAILAGAGIAALTGPQLVVVEGPAAGERLALHDGVVVGRGREVELHIADPLASRRHVLFTIRRGRSSLRDLSSKNGLVVNGRRAGRSLVALRHGDAVALGESVLVYEDAPPAGPPPGEDRGSPPRPGPPGAGRSRLPRRSGCRVATGMATLALMAIAVLLALATE
jgi:hypothetical protein